jgi:hypothetical protein
MMGFPSQRRFFTLRLLILSYTLPYPIMSLVLQAYHLLTHCQPSLGRPIGNDVEPDLVAAGNNLAILRAEIAPAWTSSAKLRGTSDVLWSCLVTLIACIYTSIHLNVPQNKDGKDGRWVLLMRHIGWAIVTLLAPELVIYMALSQYLKARHLRDQLDSLKSTKSHTIAYGFYATMGGFVTELVPEMHNTLTRVTISDQGVLFLAKRGHSCDIDDYTISNKSKAWLVGKTLIIIQVVWMAIQCVARYAYGYPLALLEVHTMVHVVCALILYGLWWPVSRLRIRSSNSPQVTERCCFLFWLETPGCRGSDSHQHLRLSRTHRAHAHPIPRV